MSKKQPLFCIALNILTRGQIIPRLEYIHADDIGDARVKYFRSEAHNHQKIQIIDVAPVIGYFAEDEEGKVLSV